jgi:alpha-beta hydrolase superfamily lysophospholipase
MARTSEDNVATGLAQDIYLPMKDDTVLVVRKISGGSKRAVLLLPGRNEHIDLPLYQDVLSDAADAAGTSYAVDLRGHGRSEGRWSMERHRADIARLLSLLHEKYAQVYVVAAGASAQVMLELEERGSKVQGMVLLLPECAKPVRVQAPTTVFVMSHSNGILKKLFGPVKVHAGWKHHATAVERAQRAQMLLDALHGIFSSEKPIRFGTQK